MSKQDLPRYYKQWQDLFVSSIRQFNDFGWSKQVNYIALDLLPYLSDPKSATQLPGIFNIPVCPPSAFSSLRDLKESLVVADVDYGPNGNGLPGSPIDFERRGYFKCIDEGRLEPGPVPFKNVTLTPGHWGICTYGTLR